MPGAARSTELPEIAEAGQLVVRSAGGDGNDVGQIGAGREKRILSRLMPWPRTLPLPAAATKSMSAWPAASMASRRAWLSLPDWPQAGVEHLHRLAKLGSHHRGVVDRRDRIRRLARIARVEEF